MSKKTFGSYTLIEENEFCGIGQHYDPNALQPYVVWDFIEYKKDVDSAIFYEDLEKAEKDYLNRSRRKGALKKLEEINRV